MANEPPQNIAAEQAVIGGVLLAPETWASIISFMVEEDFYRRDHQMIFRAIAELQIAGSPPDAVTLGEWFEEQGIAELVGGSRYILELANTTPSAANIVAYAEIVKEKANLRRLMAMAVDVLKACNSAPARNSREISASTASAMLQLSGGLGSRGAQSASVVAKEWFARFTDRWGKTGLLGIGTPWARFNTLTQGLQDGHLVVLAGRPSMGKSAVGMNIALSAAGQGHNTLIFSLEMNSAALCTMAVAILNERADRNWLRSPGEHDEGDVKMAHVGAALPKFGNLPMLIDDTAGLSADQIVLRAKREHMRKPIRLVMIDHLAIVALPGKTKESTEVGDVTRKLAGLAKALGCPVLLLSQLNRNLEARQNKRPVMSDLRESGAIEQDADEIIFVYRDDYYAKKEERPSDYPGLIEIDIAKQREGETGKVWGQFIGAHGRIDELEYEPIATTRFEHKPKHRKTYKRDDNG